MATLLLAANLPLTCSSKAGTATPGARSSNPSGNGSTDVQVRVDAVQQSADHPEFFLFNEFHVDEDEGQVIVEARQKRLPRHRP